jgi:hypothetical protein
MQFSASVVSILRLYALTASRLAFSANRIPELALLQGDARNGYACEEGDVRGQASYLLRTQLASKIFDEVQNDDSP